MAIQAILFRLRHTGRSKGTKIYPLCIHALVPNRLLYPADHFCQPPGRALLAGSSLPADP